MIADGFLLKNVINPEQLSAIKLGESKVPLYTWYHHQDAGHMQLVLTEIHLSSYQYKYNAFLDV
ncbi:HNH endonuclease [Serratia fonticola]|uniref:HNH endonuclease n=1 Tax=Serratia fonticola TaxID=47917 RepID=UPI00090423CD